MIPVGFAELSKTPIINHFMKDLKMSKEQETTAQTAPVLAELEAYPKLGSMVNYCRVTRSDDKEVLSGEKTAGVMETGAGKVIALHVDAFGRKLVRVKVGETDQKNIFLAAVNPSSETIDAILAAEQEVQRLEEEGNGIVRQTVEDFNTRVADTYIAVLGEPVVL